MRGQENNSPHLGIEGNSMKLLKIEKLVVFIVLASILTIIGLMEAPIVNLSQLVYSLGYASVVVGLGFWVVHVVSVRRERKKAHEKRLASVRFLTSTPRFQI